MLPSAAPLSVINSDMLLHEVNQFSAAVIGLVTTQTIIISPRLGLSLALQQDRCCWFFYVGLYITHTTNLVCSR